MEIGTVLAELSKSVGARGALNSFFGAIKNNIIIFEAL
jgi:hypothetical protein